MSTLFDAAPAHCSRYRCVGSVLIPGHPRKQFDPDALAELASLPCLVLSMRNEPQSYRHGIEINHVSYP